MSEHETIHGPATLPEGTWQVYLHGEPYNVYTVDGCHAVSIPPTCTAKRIEARA